MKIIPGPLSNSEEELLKFISLAEGVVKRIQIDVVDGVFAQNKTIDPSFLKDIKSDLEFDFHLMVDAPINWIEKCREGGNNRIIGQIEMMQDQNQFVEKVLEKGFKAGLAVDLATPVEKLDQSLFGRLDVVLLMSVEAGFGGQEFNLTVWDKVEIIEKIRRESHFNFKICLDGGVTAELIQDMVKAGVDEAVIGKRLFEGDLKMNIKKLLNEEN